MGITKNEEKKIWDSQKMGPTAPTLISLRAEYEITSRGSKPPPQSDLSSIVWLALKWRMRQYSELTTKKKTLTFHLLAASLSLSLSLTPFSFSALLRAFQASSFSHFSFIFIIIMNTLYSFSQFKYLLLSLLLLLISTSSSSASAYIFSGISILFFFFFLNITPNIHIK